MFNEHVQPNRPTGGAAGSRAARAEQTRVRVVDCAQRLFLTDGFAATTIRRIAADAGVSVGTVMGVGDKDTLLLAAFDRWIGAVHEARMAGAIPPPETDDPAVRAGAMIQPFLTMFDADLPLAREYGAILARGTHRTDVFSTLAESLTAQFAGILRDAGMGDAADAGGRAVYLSYLGLLMASAATGTDTSGVRAQLEEVVNVLVRPRTEPQRGDTHVRNP